MNINMNSDPNINKSVVLIDPKTEMITKKFSTAREACIYLNLDLGWSIYRCLKGEYSNYKNYILRYEIFSTPENITKWSHNHNYALDGTKRCNKCNLWLDLIEIPYYACKKCESARMRIYNDSETGFFRNLVHSSRSHAKNKLHKNRIEASVHEIDEIFIKNLYKLQDGKCFYSGLALGLKPLSDWQASIERIDQDKGYIKENSKLICLEFNSGYRQWSKEKLLQISELRNKEININDVITSVENAKIKNTIKNPRQKRTSKIIDEIIHWECTKCHNFKKRDGFKIDKKNKIYSYCKMCCMERKKKSYSELRGFVYRIVNVAKNSAKQRGKHRTDDSGTFSLTPEIIFNKIIEQKGKCYYSSIPLKLETEAEWMCSLERLDNKKGYTSENTVLICIEFNSSDYTVSATCAEGSSQWSKEKFNYFLQNSVLAIK